MKEISISWNELKELEEKDSEEFWSIYYWLKHMKLEESKKMSELEHQTKVGVGGKGIKRLSLPDSFVSNIQGKVRDLSNG